MIDRFVNSGVLVVYDGGDQFFHEKASALRFAESMESMGRFCEFYIATKENGKISPRRWIDPKSLKDK